MTPISVRPSRSFKTGRTIFALMLREMATTYGRSAVGYFWAVAEPVAGIALITFIFSIAFASPPIGNNFALYYASGFIPFFVFTDVSGKISQTIDFSKPLLFYPGVTYADALFARVFLNGITHIVVTIILISGIIILFDTRLILNIPAMGLAMAMSVFLALAVGTVNCALYWLMPSWRSIWSILTRPLFIISCVFFSFESIPSPYQDWLWYNPLVHMVGQMRRGIYSTYDGDYVSCIYFFSVSGGLFLIGLALLQRYNRDMIAS